jgi:hypothetical protein
MELFRGALLAAIVIGVADRAAAQPPTQVPIPAPAQPGVPAAPGKETPPAPTGVSQLPVTPAPLSLTPACPLPVPPATAPARAFTATAGLLIHQVAPTRVADFTRLIAYVRDALAKSTNPTFRAQAKGWKFYQDTAPGPNGDVMFVFQLDPAVRCVDYALGPILSEAYPDPAQLTEIWNLYRNSVRNGGTIMNLVEVALEAPKPIVTPPSTPVAPSTTPAAPPAATGKPAPEATQKPAPAKP